MRSFRGVVFHLRNEQKPTEHNLARFTPTLQKSDCEKRTEEERVQFTTPAPSPNMDWEKQTHLRPIFSNTLQRFPSQIILYKNQKAQMFRCIKEGNLSHRSGKRFIHDETYSWNLIITARQRSFRKVTFSVVSVLMWPLPMMHYISLHRPPQPRAQFPWTSDLRHLPFWPCPCWWHLVVITGDLFKLVHSRTSPPPPPRDIFIFCLFTQFN